MKQFTLTLTQLTLQNCKPPMDNLFKDEHKASRELQFDTLIVVLPADKDLLNKDDSRSTVILNRGDYLKKLIGSYE